MESDLPRPDRRPTWRVVDVQSLPFPKHLFRCPFELEHLGCVAAAGDVPDRYRRAFERFVSAMGPRMRECEYHQADWPLATEAALRAVKSGAAADGGVKLAAELAAVGEPPDSLTAWMAWSFFDEPIWVQGQDGPLGNGQHRVCAMKVAGVTRCPIRD
jgi:hypothetical protein